MNKSELVKELHFKTRMSEELVELFLEELIKTILTNNITTIARFGKFRKIRTKEKELHHPVTREPILIPEKTTIKFKLSKTVLEELNTNGN